MELLAEHDVVKLRAGSRLIVRDQRGIDEMKVTGLCIERPNQFDPLRLFNRT
jgi:hypothetical protein